MFTLNQLISAFQHNPLLTGGIGLSVAGTVVAYVKSLPGLVGTFGKRLFLTSINITSDDMLYSRLFTWFHMQPNIRKTKMLTARRKWIPTLNEGKGAYEICYMPAPGSHAFTYKGRRIWLSCTRKDAKDGSQAPSEEVTLTCFSVSPNFLRDMVATAHKEIEEFLNSAEVKDTISIYMQAGDVWEEFVSKKPRDLNTVILPPGIKEELTSDINLFLNSHKRYRDIGIPYHRGYLTYGPPGNGKSSIVEAIAGHFNMDLYVLSLSAPLMTDATILKLMTRVPSRAILLIEDIDAAFVGRDQTKSGGLAPVLTFSGLLNALDGVASKDGQIVFMSTNHIEKLDPAILRPGRADYKVLIENATPEQARRLFERFYPDSDLGARFAMKIVGKQYNMATIQNHLHNALTAEASVERTIEADHRTITKISQVSAALSAEASSAENSSNPWSIEVDPMALKSSSGLTLDRVR